MGTEKPRVVGYVTPPCDSTTDQYQIDLGEDTEYWLVVREGSKDPVMPATTSICGSTPFGLCVIPDVVVGPFAGYLNEVSEDRTHRFWHRRAYKYKKDTVLVGIDGAICIGAHNFTIIDKKLENYWLPSFDNLTYEGQNAFCMVGDLYGVTPEIVVVINT